MPDQFGNFKGISLSGVSLPWKQGATSLCPFDNCVNGMLVHPQEGGGSWSVACSWSGHKQTTSGVGFPE